MDAHELRSKSEGELREQLSGLLKERFSLTMQKGMGQLAGRFELRRVRRDIARVKTVLNEKLGKGSVA